MNTKFKDLKNKNIVIAGGNGFIVRQLCKAFLNQGSKVFILDIQKQKSKNNSFFLRLILQKKLI